MLIEEMDVVEMKGMDQFESEALALVTVWNL